MYRKGTPITVKGSASLLCNNLAVLPLLEKQSTSYAAVHKSFVCITNVAKGGITSQRQVTCKGESAHSSSSVLQAKWCVLRERTVLVLASAKGTQMFEPDGSIMIFWQALPPTDSNCKEGYSQFARGISGVGERHICVGLSSGSIMVFEIPTHGTAVRLQETLTLHLDAICDIVSNAGKMASSDVSGNIIIWQSGGHFTQLSKVEGCGFPCSTLCLLGSIVVGGYGTGHIRIFNASSGQLLIEACAHARWINAIDYAISPQLLLSVSEDSFIRVWELKTDKNPTLELKYQQSVSDVQLCGGKFLDQDGNSFAVTGYDLNEVVLFSKP